METLASLTKRYRIPNETPSKMPLPPSRMSKIDEHKATNGPNSLTNAQKNPMVDKSNSTRQKRSQQQQQQTQQPSQTGNSKNPNLTTTLVYSLSGSQNNLLNHAAAAHNSYISNSNLNFYPSNNNSNKKPSLHNHNALTSASCFQLNSQHSAVRSDVFVDKVSDRRLFDRDYKIGTPVFNESGRLIKSSLGVGETTATPHHNHKFKQNLLNHATATSNSRLLTNRSQRSSEFRKLNNQSILSDSSKLASIFIDTYSKLHFKAPTSPTLGGPTSNSANVSNLKHANSLSSPFNDLTNNKKPNVFHYASHNKLGSGPANNPLDKNQNKKLIFLYHNNNYFNKLSKNNNDDPQQQQQQQQRPRSSQVNANNVEQSTGLVNLLLNHGKTGELDTLLKYHNAAAGNMKRIPVKLDSEKSPFDLGEHRRRDDAKSLDVLLQELDKNDLIDEDEEKSRQESVKKCEEWLEKHVIPNLFSITSSSSFDEAEEDL